MYKYLLYFVICCYCYCYLLLLTRLLHPCQVAIAFLPLATENGARGGVAETPSSWGTHEPRRPVAWAWPTSGAINIYTPIVYSIWYVAEFIISIT